MPQFKKINPYFIVLVTIVALFFVLRVQFLGKEYAPEEVLWVRGGEGVAATGFPWAYLGEQDSARVVYTKGPMMLWLLGGAYKIFGENETVSRSVPFVFALGQIILLYFLGRRIFGGDLGKKIGLLAAFLVTISPFAVQNAVQLDLDGGIVGFFVLLILYLAWPFMSGENKQTAREKAALVLASGSAFLVRFDTPLMAFFSITLCALIFSGWRKSARFAALFAFSVAAAVGFFAAYNAAFGQLKMIFAPFRSLYSAVSGSNSTSAASRIADVFPHFNFGFLTPLAAALFPRAAFVTSSFLWLTAPLAIFLIFITGRIIWEKKIKDKKFLFLLLPSTVIFSAFAAVAPAFNYPRYIQPALLLAVLAASAYIIELFEENIISGGKKTAAAILFAFLGTAILFSRSPFSIVLFENRIRTSPLLAGFGLMASVVITAILIAFVRKEKYIAAAGLGLLALYAGFSAIIVSHDFQKPYSLSAYYGNYGFRAAGEFLKKIAGPRDTVAAVDTIGYYYGRRYYDATAYADGGIAGIKPTIVAVYRVPPQRFEKIISGKRLIGSFGTVEVYSE